MKAWHDKNTGNYMLAKTRPTDRVYEADIIGSRGYRATLRGRDPYKLRERAERFAAGLRLRGPSIEVA